MKYLLVLIVVVIGVLLLKKQWSGSSARRDRRKLDPYTSQNPETLMKTEPMMRCAHCGVFMPRSTAVTRDGKSYCSDEHARQHAG
jgi:uncharacterized protein